MAGYGQERPFIVASGNVRLRIRKQPFGQRGIVRLTRLELADQKRSRLSRGELTPFSERGSGVLLEAIAAVQMTVLIEVILDRGVVGGKLLAGFHASELRHCPFSSSERLV